jgi:hypothetical protein
LGHLLRIQVSNSTSQRALYGVSADTVRHIGIKPSSYWDGGFFVVGYVASVTAASLAHSITPVGGLNDDFLASTGEGDLE